MAKFRERHLRSYRRIAQTVHFCDDCHYQIEPGDEYEGSVWITERHGLLVFKRHAICPVDPYEEEAEILEDIERTREEEARRAEEELAEAA